MLTKKTPLIIGAGLLVVGASVFGAVSANAADTTAPVTSSVDGTQSGVPAQTADQGATSADAGWTTTQDGLSVSGAPGTPQGDSAPAEAAY
ncbi:hypothetical protein [Curtobacterium sp. MCBA15_001]|uniref:hypothetical protein n=1 Tax=Curtobacterium sp. MCBA15_001 TaxID=1898731 RepID=UPI0008DE2264|nr:hypothetical protein [Curtobacterium sp. MCBA15_001]OIH95600.1 hypothetical protein BIU90_02645 [Curtobacterium sp. MCBA15_001]